MDSLLGGLFGGQDDPDDDHRRERAQDFINRYEQGPPYEGISGDEAYHNYQAVAGRLSPAELEDSASEAFERMSPEERREFARYLQERQGGQIGDAQTDDPRRLARMTAQVQQQQPNGLGALFGGGGMREMLGGALGGGQRRGRDDGGMGDMLNNPIAKAALGGIAAIAMKKMMGGR